MLERVRNIALILLTIALIGVGIAGGQAIAFRSRTDATFLNRMQTECSEAVGLANSLARNGSAESTAVLGRIRAYVHAVDTLNSVGNTLHGGNRLLVPESSFTELYAVIDSYSAKLKNGAAVIVEEQTNLVAQLTALQSLLQAVN
jgi:hypothetical protein